jgi:lipoteichoic acid synthase
MIKAIKDIKFLQGIYVLLFVLKVLGFNVFMGLVFYNTSIMMTLGMILLVISVISLLDIKIQVTIMTITNVLLDIVLILDSIYYMYFRDFTSMFSFKYSTQSFAVINSIKYLITPMVIFLIADIAFNVIIKLIAGKLVSPMSKDVLSRMTYASIISIIAVSLLYGGITIINSKDAYAIQDLYSKKFVVERSNMFVYHYYDVKRFLQEFGAKPILSSAKVNEIKEVFSKNSIDVNSSYFGKYKGKNVILIQVESAQAFLINAKINGQEITPNLNKLSKSSVYMPNFYHQVLNGGTSDAEFTINTGLLPLSTGSVYYLFPNNNYPSLAKELKNVGYSTSVYHGDTADFWNRLPMYKTLGFDRYESLEHYSYDEKVTLGLSDKSFLRQTLGKLKEIKQPSFSFITTMSSHYPFIDKAFKDFNVGKYQGSMIGNYAQAAHYTDEELGRFFDGLKKNGMWNNSILVVYGDHHAIPYANSNELAKFLKVTISDDIDWINLQKVVAMIHLPDESIKGKMDGNLSQSDIYPTVLSLEGIKADSYIGESVFDKKTNAVLFPNGNFVYNDFLYLEDKDKTYDVKLKQQISNDTTKNLIKHYKNLFEDSDLLIRDNLFK